MLKIRGASADAFFLLFFFSFHRLDFVQESVVERLKELHEIRDRLEAQCKDLEAQCRDLQRRVDDEKEV